jgi:hypothetical protein
MMKDILIVTGTGGVGKSTICWAWAGRRGGAAINCDFFRTWIRDRSLRMANGYQEELIAKHACALTEDYMELGLDVAIDNVWTPRGVALLTSRLRDKGRINVFWLNCSREENHQRDQHRSPSDVMNGRLDELQQQLEGMEWPDYVQRIDTSGLSLDETLDLIERSFRPLPADPDI